MVNHESKILELITRNGLLKVRELCKRTGLHETSVKRFIKPLFTKGLLKRASDWSYSINTDPLPVESEKFARLAKQASELEAKGFWLRAAQVWREAMLVAKFDASRNEAKENCDRCVVKGSLNCGSYGGLDTGRIISASVHRHLL
ncbi:PerC family transcriptional regulator [Mixta mediterraneensis]|uniref:PerC family transcriptional regulator n=1 Tax=Mixta mediterraneensis TaxID=2758443 RepID=UPI001875C147|nr:PerC family transcriptional regulator [Mixta mediterraneensis]MBE5251601.1 PerC family transcriptional regulator [Mixta mediterraneensis]